MGTGARVGLSGACPEAVGTEGRGGIPKRVCEDGTWARREEAAARMAWAPGVPSGRSAHQQLQQARHGLPVWVTWETDAPEPGKAHQDCSAGTADTQPLLEMGGAA